MTPRLSDKLEMYLKTILTLERDYKPVRINHIAKARGVRLGRHGAEVLAPQYRDEARQRAEELQPLIAELKGRGLSLAKIAGELNRRKVPTPRRGRWDHSSVRNVLNRLAVQI